MTPPAADPRSPARQAVARAQAELAAALAGGSEPPPPGFDGAKLRAAARSLAHKRRRSAERAWPALADALGPRFAGRFEAYAGEVPASGGGPAADARRFAEWLHGRGELPAAAAIGVAVARAGRGWPVHVVRAGGATVVAVRCLRVGVFAFRAFAFRVRRGPILPPRRGDGL